MKRWLLILILLPSIANAVDTWDGLGDGHTWSDGNNWVDNTAPGPGDGVTWLTGIHYTTNDIATVNWMSAPDIYGAGSVTNTIYSTGTRTITGAAGGMYLAVANSSSLNAYARFNLIGACSWIVDSGATDNWRMSKSYSGNNNTLMSELWITDGATMTLTNGVTPSICPDLTSYNWAKFVNNSRFRVVAPSANWTFGGTVANNQHCLGLFEYYSTGGTTEFFGASSTVVFGAFMKSFTASFNNSVLQVGQSNAIPANFFLAMSHDGPSVVTFANSTFESFAENIYLGLYFNTTQAATTNRTDITFSGGSFISGNVASPQYLTIGYMGNVSLPTKKVTNTVNFSGTAFSVRGRTISVPSIAANTRSRLVNNVIMSSCSGAIGSDGSIDLGYSGGGFTNYENTIVFDGVDVTTKDLRMGSSSAGFVSSVTWNSGVLSVTNTISVEGSVSFNFVGGDLYTKGINPAAQAWFVASGTGTLTTNEVGGVVHTYYEASVPTPSTTDRVPRVKVPTTESIINVPDRITQ